MTESYSSTTSANPNIPSCAWSRAIGLGWTNPYTVRYSSNIDDGAWHGMPLGGFGAGCVGRSSRGDFNLWHIDGGEHLFRNMSACQFSIFEQADEQTQAYALSTEIPETELPSWTPYPASQAAGEGLPDRSTGEYSALYPRSWFVYRNVLQAELTCEQFSPIWAENYQETSYPVALFQWTAHNPSDRPLTLSIMLTWENMVGWFTNSQKSPEVKVRDDGSPVYEYQPRLGESQGNVNQWRAEADYVGCLMGGNLSESPAEGEGQWAILAEAANVEVFHHMRWNPAGDGAEVWQSFSQDGSLPNVADATPAAQGERVAGAIALRFTLAPGETRQIPFAVAWDFPVTEFAEGVIYYRRYTDFFGRNGRNAWAIAQTALQNHLSWQQQIQQWQQPILDRADLPDWFKMALFNELYDLTSGGTLWSAASDRDPVGQFAVLECLDYRWYESLDVRLYGSFALLMLFPDLDKAILRAFARAIPTEDNRTRTIGYYYTIGKPSPEALRKAKNATPHDLGAPNEHVWEKTNYTSYQDCNLWKDLGSDFVLQVYRDFVLTGSTDYAFLAECWSAVTAAIAYLKTFDLDNDGIPENSGAPDQTFDDWRLQGVSAYCGGLWIAALEAAIAIAQVLIKHPVAEIAIASLEETIAIYQTWLDQSRPIYQEKLWNGEYYRLDSDSGSDVVMADQLCGQFYARLLGLPDVVPIACAQSALATIYDSCFLKFHDGKLGAANGVKLDGSPVNPKDTHPLEVWTGINFGLAAFLVQMGMRDEAMQITEAVVQQVYEHGLQFRTPEAITAAQTFRASHYLRAMAIWGVYGLLPKPG
ncbi:MAG: bile acid beta-glucosidase [Drouetiella hepatica Uher 2000/2452]|jgi:non-lysosomal glucosylceramidase|uniref:Bile acid beta-glucosidase n=1 Tax=Drouetiella hepatica Uher 2000/2452 TaxID=904376 RepID=A0A951UKL0_9CYAN|nr:bile acid beta-glucosidase [Drouetiella hepatica Uher 2000/2452]